MVEGSQSGVDQMQTFIVDIAAQQGLHHGFVISESWDSTAMARCVGLFVIHRDTHDVIASSQSPPGYESSIA